MRLSDTIEAFIKEMMGEEQQEVEIKRNELAEFFNCAPSQINYVLATRFTPDHGYVTSSQRGGGGYIRIRKIAMSQNDYLMHFYQAIGMHLDRESAGYFLTALVEKSLLTPREARLLAAAFSDSALAKLARRERDVLRADLMKNTILQILSDKEG